MGPYPTVPVIAHYDMQHDKAAHTLSTLLVLWDGEQLMDADAGFAGNEDLAAELLGFRPTRYVPAQTDGTLGTAVEEDIDEDTGSDERAERAREHSMSGGAPGLDRYRGPEYRRLLAAARKSLERTGGQLTGRISVADPDDDERKAIIGVTGVHQPAGIKRMTVPLTALDAALTRGTGFGLAGTLAALGEPLRNRPAAAASFAATRAALSAPAEGSPLYDPVIGTAVAERPEPGRHAHAARHAGDRRRWVRRSACWSSSLPGR